MTKLIVGCGYLGLRVAARWRDAGSEVNVVTRSVERVQEFERLGYRAVVADVTQPETLGKLPAAETVLFAVGFDRSSAESIDTVYAGGMQNVLNALPPETGRLIYISTTGVYGPAGGEWVDERTPPDPQREGGRASLAAEGALTQHPLGERSVILRLAGIYGPGRVPFLKDLQSGAPIAAPTDGYLNLIHVDDAAHAVIAAAKMQFDKFSKENPPPLVYCVSDGQPVERGEFYRELARRIGAPPPRFIEPERDSSRAARARSNRRVRNNRMLAELNVSLNYPNYRTGLASLLETQNQQRND